MSSLNWRTKSIKSSTCKNNTTCIYVPPTMPDTYIPSTLTRSTFTTVGNNTWTAPAYVTSVEYLVVGGGGGGGGAYDNGGAGGGGGGVVLTGTKTVVPGQTYNIIVGDGGAGGESRSSNEGLGPAYEYDGNKGSSSNFDSIFADGGGYGYRSRVTNASSGTKVNGTIASFGGNGGGGGHAGYGGGGNSANGSGINGGAGFTSTISGSSVEYGRGGDGKVNGSNSNGSAGTPYTGNGGQGGGAASGNHGYGGKGGSGIVILKYYV